MGAEPWNLTFFFFFTPKLGFRLKQVWKLLLCGIRALSAVYEDDRSGSFIDVFLDLWRKKEFYGK